jgi:hypothetical protein
MVRPRLWGLWCCLVAWPACTGCLTLYCKHEVLRGEERRVPVHFETAKAAQVFEAHVRHQEACLSSGAFCVPFVTLYAYNKQLSANALFNDAVEACDRDHNGILTEEEVFAYCGKAAPCEEVPELPAPTGPALPAEPVPHGKP